jgi:hypothetical protein
MDYFTISKNNGCSTNDKKDARLSANIAAQLYLGGNMDKKDKKPIGVAIIGCSFSFYN